LMEHNTRAIGTAQSLTTTPINHKYRSDTSDISPITFCVLAAVNWKPFAEVRHPALGHGCGIVRYPFRLLASARVHATMDGWAPTATCAVDLYPVGIHGHALRCGLVKFRASTDQKGLNTGLRHHLYGCPRPRSHTNGKGPHRVREMLPTA